MGYTRKIVPARKLFRAMLKDAQGRPRCGARANTLGIRPGHDIRANADDTVHPETGGLSVTPDDPARLPPHLRPSHLGGRGALPLFSIEVAQLEAALTYRPDPKHPTMHGFIEPARSMRLVDYQDALCRTAPAWTEESP
jgi:hypothetical protein